MSSGSSSPGEVATGRRRPRIGLTQQIFIGLAVGIAIGAIINNVDPAWSAYARPFSQLFLRMIKMIIAPLIFATLVAGIAGAGHVKVVGRMGIRALIYFEIVTTIALVNGLVAVTTTRPGEGVVLPPSYSNEYFLGIAKPFKRAEIQLLGDLLEVAGSEKITVTLSFIAYLGSRGQ